LNLNGIFLTSKLKPREFRTSFFFIGAFTRGSREEVMIFFEKNKVLGVEPNRVLNILEGILKTNTT
jgi:hypothetical protein